GPSMLTCFPTRRSSDLSKDWEWLSFVTRYCAGRNVDKPLCEDFMWWALGVTALVVVVVAWWILGKIAKAHESWKHRRMLAKVAEDRKSTRLNSSHQIIS